MDQRTGFHELGLGKAAGVLVLVFLSLSLPDSADDQRRSVHGRRRRGVQMEEPQTTPSGKPILWCQARR
jgi:hypothetical protein